MGRRRVPATCQRGAHPPRVAAAHSPRATQRTIVWEDKHESRTHVDTTNSTWLIGRDEQGGKCVQFVLAQWMEGADKNQEFDIDRQLKKVRAPPEHRLIGPSDGHLTAPPDDRRAGVDADAL